MASYPPGLLDEIRAGVDVVELVGRFVNLRKAGQNYKGLCPFHAEKTPSFMVNPRKGIFHCFGCGVGGDAISFVRETEGLDFVGAIEWLADRFHVQLEYEETSPQVDARRRRRERLFALLEQAAAFYERTLWESDAAAAAREYVASRGFDEEVCREFRLGLSPAGTTLTSKAAEKGYTRDELADAGLLTRRGSDYFQQRLMFPLADARGRVIGFQARKLHESDPLRGKYVNSPESELFHKSNVLYGLHLARSTIAKQDRAVVVEGNPDVIALRQAGLHPVVASMGTALTGRQLKELARLTSRIYLCFDADAAGEEATLRGMELAVREGLDVRVVALPKGKDPADDPANFEPRLRNAEPYAVHRVRIELERARDRQHAYLRVQDVLNGLPESPERYEAWRLANDRLGLTVELRAAVAGTATTGRALSPRLVDAGERLERNALAGVRAHPGLTRLLAELGPEHFRSETHRTMREQLLAETASDADLAAPLAELDAIAAAEGIDEATAKDLLFRLRERDLRRQLAEAEASADLERTKELQVKIVEMREAVGKLA
jgi:DNA primase